MKKLLVIFLCQISLIFAQDKYKLSGFTAAGYEFQDANKLRKFNQQVYYQGKLQFEFKPNENIETQIQLDGSSEDAKIILKEISTKFDYFKKVKFKVGNIKRPFGMEQLTSEEDLLTINKSQMLNSISRLGYGGRSVSIMAYYNYSKKRSEYPYSYYLSIFKDNSLNSGAACRVSLHDEDMAYSLNYLFQSKGGDEAIKTHGLSADLSYQNEEKNVTLEAFYIQDPVESNRRKTAVSFEKIYAGGAKLLGAVKLPAGVEFIESIEPLLLLGFYCPDLNSIKYHTYEILAGINVYLDKDVRFRINADGLLTKNLYNEDYSTIGSKLLIEVQVRF